MDDVFSITSSRRILKSEWKTEGSIPFIRVRDMVQLANKEPLTNEFFVSEEFYASRPDEEKVIPGDIIVSSTSTIGKTYVIKPGERFYFKDADVLLFRKKQPINEVFFTYGLTQPTMWDQIAGGLGATTVSHFLISKACKLMQPMPPMELQERFAIFAQQSDKSKFTGHFKSQFIEMFGELDNNTKNYPIKKLNEIADYWNGLTYKPTDAVQDGTGILVLRSSNIQNGELSFEDNVRVTCPIKEKLFVKDNDILMCSRNGSAALVGKTALIKGLKEPMSFGAFMMIIRSMYYPFLKTYFELPTFRNQISTSTSTINQITGKMLNDISIPVPDIAAVEQFRVFIEQTDKSKYVAFQETKFIENSLKYTYNHYFRRKNYVH